MRRFVVAVAIYLVIFVGACAAVVLHGDGPVPVVTAVVPRNGDGTWPGGIAELNFSQAMDESSVERGLQVSPLSQLQETWRGRTLYFQPVLGWTQNAEYRVDLIGAIEDTQGADLHVPLSFRFRVHSLGHVGYCSLHGVRNLCEYLSTGRHPLTDSRQPVLSYAPSPFVQTILQSSSNSTLRAAQVWTVAPVGDYIAFTRRDGSGLPHVFLLRLDGMQTIQLTRGKAYADEGPYWTYNDDRDLWYFRRPVARHGTHLSFGPAQTAHVTISP